MTPPDLVVLGNLLVDDLVFDDGRTRMAQPGGAVLHVALAAAMWGVRAGCVSPLGSDYPSAALDTLRERGISLDGLVPMHAPGVRTWILYEGTRRHLVHRLDGPTHEAVSPAPEHLPRGWRRARANHVAPMPFACQQALVRAIRQAQDPAAPAWVSLDPHVPLTPASLPDYRDLLADVDVFLPSDDEMLLPDAGREARGALAALAGGRLAHVLWKRGAAGGFHFDVRNGTLQPWRAVPTDVVDPTGAGDAFAAGFMSACLEGRPIAEARTRAAVSAAIALSDWGPQATLRTTPDAARARLAASLQPEDRA